MPLYHFATTALPADTIAPEMSDTNAATALKSDARFTHQDLSAGACVDEEIMGSPEQKIALLRVGGRGALV
ncbi:L-aminoadipate-semialdehyde dehydrogenase large subunit protein [Rutstroemia sp. NJR-2017a BBW]|nr:L-aminoadipate-semialdehyde dehydrogenase large subunit protein [Rutstroemia sp. NJR-2017a BBW]